MTGKLSIAALVVAGIAIVGALDHWGGAIFAGPLYYLPLALAAWFLDRGAALVAALVTALVWAVVSLEAGSPYAEPIFWSINLFLQGAVFVLVTYLISTLRKSLREVRENRRIDLQTGLATQRSFFERAGSVLAVCHRDMRSATLARIELQDFKQLSRRRQERFLQDISDTLARQLRASDVTAHTDDDAFVMLLPETAERDARRALENLADRLREHSAGEESVAFHIAAASFTPAPADLVTMMKAASAAMRRALAAGKDSVVIESINGFETSTAASEAAMAASPATGKDKTAPDEPGPAAGPLLH